MDKENLKKGGIYKVKCRNLNICVYDGEGGFIGIRTKFGQRYLFTEYHNPGGYFDSVTDAEYLNMDCPDNIPISEYLRSNSNCLFDNEELFNLLDNLEKNPW